MNIDGISACITGAGSGLGLATAQRLAELGASVVLIDLPGSNGEAAAGAIGPRASSSRRASQRGRGGPGPSMQRRRWDRCGWRSTAQSIATPNRVMRKGEPTALEDFERVVSINLVGTFNVVRTAAARMAVTDPEGEERGVIVNTASVAAFDGQVGQAAYAASKAGVAGMTLPLARDLAQFLIRVVTIAPGTFETPMLAGLPEEARKCWASRCRIPAVWAKPSEYAALVQHIVENPMLNGETIRLDGSIRMAPR